MKAFTLPIDALLLRFYLMMALVIVAGFTGFWAIAFLAIPVFMTCLLGIRFGRTHRKDHEVEEESQPQSAGVHHTRVHRQHAA